MIGTYLRPRIMTNKREPRSLGEEKQPRQKFDQPLMLDGQLQVRRRRKGAIKD